METIKDKTAVVGIGETTYYKHGGAPVTEFRLVLEAITKAADDAGIDVRDIDGFASYSNDRNDPPRLASALGTKDLAFSNMVWGGGGGGGSGAVANAVAALAAGYANYVVVYRGLAQGQFGRFGQAAPVATVGYPMSYTMPYGLMSPAQMFAMRVRRFMHEYNVGQSPMRAISMASYRHAQSNPRAVMRGRPLSEEDYDNSRWIVEPFHLFDCCQENDGAAAVMLTTAERAEDMKQKPAYVLAAAQGSDYRQAAPVHNAPDYATSNFKTVAKRLYGMAGVGPERHGRGAVVRELHRRRDDEPGRARLLRARGGEEFMTLENFSAPDGKLPINTSGGNLAECYMHGLELVTEAVRQVRGTSTSQVHDVELSMVCSGPMVQPVSDLILRG